MSWVVFRFSVGSRVIWAWGLAGAGPSFDQLYFTSPNGLDPIDVDHIPELTEFLFAIPAVDAEVPPKGESFPSSSAPPARSDIIGAMGIPAGDAD